VGQVASKVSAIPGVRAALLELQRAFAAEHPGAPNGAVLDGRDIGTVICPDANLKIYLTADAGARGLRRHAEAPADGTLEEITASIRERDAREASRAVAPMRPAEDAVVIDTSHLSADGVLLRALGEFQARLPAFSLLGW
jgi:cytidylate kinase